ncbi:MAG: RNA polymerase sigma factor [Chitinophagaceae bacterium]
MSKFKNFTDHSERENAIHDYEAFELLYDKYAPKAYGFIVKHTNSKEQAEEFLTKVFLKVWDDIKTFDKDAEKKIQQIVLLVCKPLYRRI